MPTEQQSAFAKKKKKKTECPTESWHADSKNRIANHVAKHTWELRYQACLKDRAISMFIQLNNWCEVFQGVNRPSDNNLPVPRLTSFQQQFHGIKRMTKKFSPLHHRFQAILAMLQVIIISHHCKRLSSGQYNNESAPQTPTITAIKREDHVMVLNNNSSCHSRYQAH